MNVLVTGAASGLGLSTARMFANKGHNVFSCDIIKPIEEENIKFYKVDVTNINDINEMKSELISENVKLDLIINFAGIYDIGSFIEKDLNDIKKVFDVNLIGAININNIMHELLIEKGRIIIVTSEVASLDPLPFNGLYSVSKAALDSYAQSLRQELNLLGQKVITIRPGAFNTKLSAGSLDATQKLVDETKLYKRHSKKFLKIVKMFMGKPQEPIKLAKLIYKVSLKNTLNMYIVST